MKVKILSLKEEKHSMKSQGHRQNYTEVEIQSILKGKLMAQKVVVQQNGRDSESKRLGKKMG